MLTIFNSHGWNRKHIPSCSHGVSNIEDLLLTSHFQDFGHHGRNIILAHLVPTEKRLPITDLMGINGSVGKYSYCFSRYFQVTGISDKFLQVYIDKFLMQNQIIFLSKCLFLFKENNLLIKSPVWTTETCGEEKKKQFKKFECKPILNST